MLSLQTHINSTSKTLKWNNTGCVVETCQNMLPLITQKKTGLNGCVYDFSVE